MALENITLNGRPVADYISAVRATEIEKFCRKTKQRAHIVTRVHRNHSRARSGRGRVIYSVER